MPHDLQEGTERPGNSKCQGHIGTEELTSKPTLLGPKDQALDLIIPPSYSHTSPAHPHCVPYMLVHLMSCRDTCSFKQWSLLSSFTHWIQTIGSCANAQAFSKGSYQGKCKVVCYTFMVMSIKNLFILISIILYLPYLCLGKVRLRGRNGQRRERREEILYNVSTYSSQHLIFTLTFPSSFSPSPPSTAWSFRL